MDEFKPGEYIFIIADANGTPLLNDAKYLVRQYNDIDPILIGDSSVRWVVGWVEKEINARKVLLAYQWHHFEFISYRNTTDAGAAEYEEIMKIQALHDGE